MIFQRPASRGPVGRLRLQARQGSFALEPPEALPRLADRISRLADRALEPNPFFLPEFLAPAIMALGPRRLKLATFSDREDLRFFAPVVVSGGRLFGGARLTVWAHSYAPLGTPLLDRETAPYVAEALIRSLRTSGRSLLGIPELPLDGLVSRTLKAAAQRRGFWTVAAEQRRPVLAPSGGAEFEQMVTQKRRRELDRQLRRLCETGAVSMMSARTGSEIESAFNMFVGLESSGWKGRRGTALQRLSGTREFARTAVAQLAQKGLAVIDVMRVGDQPVAALIRLEHGGLSIPWKIAFDEAFAAYSPGKQLMCDETRRWLGDPAVTRVDPVCEESNPLMAGLWRTMEPYGTLLVTSRRWGVGARLRAGVINLRSEGKRQAKALLRPRKAPKPVAKAEPRSKPAAKVEPPGKPAAGRTPARKTSAARA